MTDIATDIDLAAELLDAYRDEMDDDEFDRRRKLLDEARAPRVAYMTRKRLADEAVAGLTAREDS